MKVITLAVLCTVLLLSLAACFALPIEDPVPPPPITRIPPARQFRTAIVTRGDVIRSNMISAFLVATQEDRLMFEVDGLRIQSINVGVGDNVNKGDVVAVLAWPSIENQLDAANTRRTWLELDLEHAQARHERVLDAAYQTGVPIDDARYLSDILRFQREMALLETELEYLIYLNEKRYLRATMDGSILQVVHFTQGMLSNSMQTVAVIVDQADSIFEVRYSAAPNYMSLGDYFVLTINREPHLVVVVDPDDFGVDRGSGATSFIYLAFAEDPPTLTGTQVAGSITLIREQAFDVVRIPLRALNIVGDRTFVFVIDEYGVRTLRDVELGVRGNTTIEVLSGLYEGEVIIDE